MRALARLAPLAAATALLVLAALPGGRPAWAETLTDALIGAYESSHLLEQNRAVLRAADEGVAGAVAALRPVLSWAASVSRGYSDGAGWGETRATLGLEAQITLFDFGRSRLGIEVQKESVLATRQQLVGIEQNVLYAAVEAYMNVLSALETVAINENNQWVIAQELQASRDRLELGDGTSTDVAQAEARAALADANVSAARGSLVAAREAYKAAVGRYPGNLQPPHVPPHTAGSAQDAAQIAVRRHPSVLQAQRQVTIAELNIALAAAGMRPSLGAKLSAGVDQDGDNSSSIGLTVSGPLYSGGALSATLRKAEAQRDAARAALLQTVVGVQQAVAVQWAQVQVAAAQLNSGAEQVRAARVAYAGVREQASLGNLTTLDVLNAEQEVLSAEAARISAFSSYYTASYGLLSTMGLLTVEHLNLGIPTYDPLAYYNAVRTAPGSRVSPQGQKLDRVLRATGRN